MVPCVSRQGQTKKLTVIRFVAENTLEEVRLQLDLLQMIVDYRLGAAQSPGEGSES